MTENTNQINTLISERGFHLYEWISKEELQLTLERDYLKIVSFWSIPLAGITGVAGILGFAGGYIGSILAIGGILFLFYSGVGIFLFFRFLSTSYLYTRGANVIITDNHYVTGEKIIEKTNIEAIGKEFQRYEIVFDEKFLGESELIEKKKHEQKKLFENLKSILFQGGKILQKFGDMREMPGNMKVGLLGVIFIAGVLYGIMMSLVYFLGIFFILIGGKIFSGITHWTLLRNNSLEYTIQNLFTEIHKKADVLETTKDSLVVLLEDARKNEWKDNLSGNIHESIQLFTNLASKSTEEAIQLEKLLKTSRYQDIFNFSKYHSWIKKQILIPLQSFISLLNRNREILDETKRGLEDQIKTTKDSRHRGILEVQKKRLELQEGSFQETIQIFGGYIKKLEESFNSSNS